MSYYKAVTPQGTSFRDGTVKWAVGKVTRHPSTEPIAPDDAETYLSASTEPADCSGFEWPCRLFEVEPVGETLTVSDKVGAKAWRVVRELPAHQALGPSGEAVAAFIEQCKRLTAAQARRLAAAWTDALTDARDVARYDAVDAAWTSGRAASWDATWDAAWTSARAAAAADAARSSERDASWEAMRYAATRYPIAEDITWDTAGDAAGYAAGALLVQDQITPEQFGLLTKPWRDAGLELPE
jgi:hypothetical protein